jgi:hypothetical protein
MDAEKIKAIILHELSEFDQEMEGYEYYRSNRGVSCDDYENIADNVVRAISELNKGE